MTACRARQEAWRRYALGLCALVCFSLWVGTPGAAAAEPQSAVVPEPVFSDRAEHTLYLSSEEPVASLELGASGLGVDLSNGVALSFQIRGAVGDEFVALALGSGGDPPEQFPLGNIYKYLPAGITVEWKQVNVPLPEQVKETLPRARCLEVRLEGGESAAVSIRMLAVLPRRAGTEDWHIVVLSPQDYGVPDLGGVSTIVLDHYEGLGTRVVEISSQPQPRPAEEGLESSLAAQARLSRDYFLVARFEVGPPTAPPGSIGTFQRAPSSVSAEVEPESSRSGGSSLRLDYDKQEEGFCGVWMQLGKAAGASSSRAFFDASRFRYLTFWVRGEKGNEDVSVQLADAQWERSGDSVPLAHVSALLPNGITADWQEVAIRLDPGQYADLDFSQLASISFNFRRPGAGTIFIDDVAFKVSRRTRLPELMPRTAKKKKVHRELPRATWIWDTSKILAQEAAREEMFRFAEQEGIKTLFVQIGCEYRTVGGEVVCRLEKENPLRRFIGEAHERGIEVHALDGYAYHVLPAWQPRVLAQVHAVVDFNTRVAPEERFAGIHHDNEPYLLSSFAGTRGDLLLLHLIDLAAACQQLVRQAPGRLVYGVDIPLWFSTRTVTWHGERKPVSHHLIDTVDLVAVMAYRTTANDANGVTTLAADQVAYASRAGKRAFVALETTPLPLEISYVFIRGALPETTTGGTYLLSEDWPGTAILYWKDFDAAPSGEGAPAPPVFPTGSERANNFQCVRKAVIPSSRLSFAESTREALEKVIAAVIGAFGDQPGFAGVAIHDYEGYRKLAGRQETAP